MPQHATRNGRLPGGLYNNSEDTPKDLNFHESGSIPITHSNLRRPSNQVNLEKARNRLRKSQSSKARPSGFFKRVYTKWKTAWRLQSMILGLYIVALTCACAHWLFFEYLDGRLLAWNAPVVVKTTMIPQGYATTISLLLITAFKAALTGSVGLCYTQSLWGMLRKRALKIGIIEDLFQITTNALHLTSSGVYLEAPVLALAALFCWIMPIATVYPPGALIVNLQVLPVNTTFNVSAFSAKDSMSLTGLAPIACTWKNTSGGLTVLLELAGQEQQASVLDGCFVLWEWIDAILDPFEDARYVTSLSLVSGEMATLSQPGGLNSSYHLSFWGTILSCETTNRTVEEGFSWNSEHDETPGQWYLDPFINCKLMIDTQLMGSSGITTFQHSVVFPELGQTRYYPCFEEPENPALGPGAGSANTLNVEKYILMPVEDTSCRPKFAKYHVTVSSSGMGQHVSVFLDENENVPTYTTEFKAFNGSFEQWVHLSDALAIYNVFAAALNGSDAYQTGATFDYTNGANKTAYASSNGTAVETCTMDRVAISLGNSGLEEASDLWRTSVFKRRPSGSDPSLECPRFDMDMANELLINSTISALALNRHFDTVNGTETQTFNVYRFENKLAFFLPYGLSLAIAMPIIALGLISFYAQNHGVSAITGGFLQLLMTTTGRTDLEGMIIKESGTLGGYENVSDELKAVEVRFGELMEVRAGELVSDVEEAQNLPGGREDSASFVSRVDSLEKNEYPMGRVGFGLAHEVRPLRRRNVE